MLDEKRGSVIVWLGRDVPRAQFDAYLDASDGVTEGGLHRDLGGEFLDHDFLGSVWEEEALPVEKLLRFVSHTPEFFEAVREAARSMPMSTANCAIVLFDHTMSPPSWPESSPFRFVGVFPYSTAPWSWGEIERDGHLLLPHSHRETLHRAIHTKLEGRWHVDAKSMAKEIMRATTESWHLSGVAAEILEALSSEDRLDALANQLAALKKRRKEVSQADIDQGIEAALQLSWRKIPRAKVSPRLRTDMRERLVSILAQRREWPAFDLARSVLEGLDAWCQAHQLTQLAQNLRETIPGWSRQLAHSQVEPSKGWTPDSVDTMALVLEQSCAIEWVLDDAEAGGSKDNASPYSPKSELVLGEWVDHPEFGLGKVVEIDSDRAQVQFDERKVLLVHRQ